jgi:hypothetical protein
MPSLQEVEGTPRELTVGKNIYQFHSRHPIVMEANEKAGDLMMMGDRTIVVKSRKTDDQFEYLVYRHKTF